jgi:hypothetical protein
MEAFNQGVGFWFPKREVIWAAMPIMNARVRDGGQGRGSPWEDIFSGVELLCFPVQLLTGFGPLNGIGTVLRSVSRLPLRWQRLS